MLQLLVGIKDTNEQLVSVTLRALADLVPVLGAAAVVGGKRAKLFTDGRPKVHTYVLCVAVINIIIIIFLSCIRLTCMLQSHSIFVANDLYSFFVAAGQKID